MADKNHTVYGEEDLDEDDDEESEDQYHLRHSDAVVEDDEEDEDVDVDDDDDSTSSSNLAATDAAPPPLPPPFPTSSAPGEVTVAVAGVSGIRTDSFPDQKRQRVDDVVIPTVVLGERKPLPLDESRRLFQRLWTDEDEIELLQGFLDYTTQRGTNNSSHHHDTTGFYDQIKNKLQLDFNKNQLVEKLRRLKKKYRNVVSKIGSGKEYVFKSPHDHATFEISRKIWSGATTATRGGGEEGGLDEEDSNPNPNPNFNLNDHINNGFDAEKKVPKPRKRSRGVKIEEKHGFSPQVNPSIGMVTTIAAATATPVAAAGPSIPSLIEDTVRSCLSPLFKELLQNTVSGPCSSRGFGLALNPMPLSFGGSLSFTGGDLADERWRKQQILELEVYSKRLELVQDQIKARLDELRLMGS